MVYYYAYQHEEMYSIYYSPEHASKSVGGSIKTAGSTIKAGWQTSGSNLRLLG